jgi:lysophospholipase L1-like esterase
MRIPTHSFIRTAGLAIALGSSALFAAEPALQLKDNDVWVMAGDSITAQRQHSNYIEAYYRTRFPNLNLHFRNSGIGGNRTSSILARFDYDVAAWKPTIVSIELGMNDVGGTEEAYIKGMKELIAKIRAIPAQPVLISSSPVDDGSMMNSWKSPRCEKIHPFTEALKKLADEEKVVFVDQYHPLIDLWGNNRRKGEELAVKNGTWPPKPKPATPAPLATPNPTAGPTPVPRATPTPIAPSVIPLGGDPVHPGPVGQYNMAAVILKGFKAPGEVSSATLKADGKVVEAKRCKITDVSAKDGNLTFTRLDESSPWPIQPSAKSALKLMPEIVELSQYLLKVEGLPAGDYKVNLNGKPAATVSAKDLAAGWNIASVVDGPLGDRANAIATLISKLQGPLNMAWRDASKAKDAEKLAAAQKAIDEAEAELQKLVQPVAWKFEIVK